MTPENFCYWLQGFTELQPGMEQPTPAQWKAITEHLQHVFQKVTPKVERVPTVGPIVAAPARHKTPEDYLRETIAENERIARNTRLGFPSLPDLGTGITITC